MEDKLKAQILELKKKNKSKRLEKKPIIEKRKDEKKNLRRKK